MATGRYSAPKYSLPTTSNISPGIGSLEGSPGNLGSMINSIDSFEKSVQQNNWGTRDQQIVLDVMKGGSISKAVNDYNQLAQEAGAAGDSLASVQFQQKAAQLQGAKKGGGSSGGGGSSRSGRRSSGGSSSSSSSGSVSSSSSNPRGDILQTYTNPDHIGLIRLTGKALTALKADANQELENLTGQELQDLQSGIRQTAAAVKGGLLSPTDGLQLVEKGINTYTGAANDIYIRYLPYAGNSGVKSIVDKLNSERSISTSSGTGNKTINDNLRYYLFGDQGNGNYIDVLASTITNAIDHASQPNQNGFYPAAMIIDKNGNPVPKMVMTIESSNKNGFGTDTPTLQNTVIKFSSAENATNAGYLPVSMTMPNGQPQTLFILPSQSNDPTKIQLQLPVFDQNGNGQLLNLTKDTNTNQWMGDNGGAISMDSNGLPIVTVPGRQTGQPIQTQPSNLEGLKSVLGGITLNKFGLDQPQIQNQGQTNTFDPALNQQGAENNPNSPRNLFNVLYPQNVDQENAMQSPLHNALASVGTNYLLNSVVNQGQPNPGVPGNNIFGSNYLTQPQQQQSQGSNIFDLASAIKQQQQKVQSLTQPMVNAAQQRSRQVLSNIVNQRFFGNQQQSQPQQQQQRAQPAPNPLQQVGGFFGNLFQKAENFDPLGLRHAASMAATNGFKSFTNFLSHLF